MPHSCLIAPFLALLSLSAESRNHSGLLHMQSAEGQIMVTARFQQATITDTARSTREQLASRRAQLVNIDRALQWCRAGVAQMVEPKPVVSV